MWVGSVEAISPLPVPGKRWMAAATVTIAVLSARCASRRSIEADGGPCWQMFDHSIAFEQAADLMDVADLRLRRQLQADAVDGLDGIKADNDRGLVAFDIQAQLITSSPPLACRTKRGA
jgi:hypothetical protein